MYSSLYENTCCCWTQAIFGGEYHLVSLNPPCFTIKLMDPINPGALDNEAGDEGAKMEEEGTGGPPSRLFTFRFKLPKVLKSCW
jgi:hypothetical protein